MFFHLQLLKKKKNFLKLNFIYFKKKKKKKNFLKK